MLGKLAEEASKITFSPGLLCRDCQNCVYVYALGQNNLSEEVNLVLLLQYSHYKCIQSNENTKERKIDQTRIKFQRQYKNCSCFLQTAIWRKDGTLVRRNCS